MRTLSTTKVSERIADLGAAVAERLATQTEPVEFVRVERGAQQGSQTVMRIFTGTIPDYAQEAEGLLLSGVVGGGPAETAGLQRGDVIIELSGQDDREYLRLHLRPRLAEGRRAGRCGLHAW